MRPSLLLTSLLILGLQCAVASEAIHCDQVQHFKPKGLRESHAAITLKGQTVQSFSYSGVMASGEEGGGHVCELAVTRADKKTRWESTGAKTRIWLEEKLDSDEPSIEITRSGGTTVIAMNVAPPPYCSFGAEFPSKMTRQARGRCVVTY